MAILLRPITKYLDRQIFLQEQFFVDGYDGKTIREKYPSKNRGNRFKTDYNIIVPGFYDDRLRKTNIEIEMLEAVL